MAENVHENPVFMENIADIAQRAGRGEVIVKEELGITEGQMEAMYAVAYNQFQNGKYDDAAKSFSLLSMFDPLEYKYLFGIASCFHMKGDYQAASLYYIVASGLDENDPAPFLHVGECMLAMKDKEGATEALKIALERSGDKPQYAPMRKRAEVMLENIG
ncbi:MAG: SycD/LcrH family type III secretion system chaperone [Desulfovibrionales bacterium]|nr:SycD/LcrH family type III secretion system chaperone [Desulfovibrionales bacterium]